MSALILNDEHLEVLYVLLNEEQDPKYFLPKFEAVCNELVEHGYMRLLSRITGKLKPQVEAAGLRAFLDHYGTREIMKALKAHVERTPLSDEHWALLWKLANGDPIKAPDIEKETLAYDLVNVGYVIALFPSSGTVYYCRTHEGSIAARAHHELVTA